MTLKVDRKLKVLIGFSEELPKSIGACGGGFEELFIERPHYVLLMGMCSLLRFRVEQKTELAWHAPASFFLQPPYAGSDDEIAQGATQYFHSVAVEALFELEAPPIWRPEDVQLITGHWFKQVRSHCSRRRALLE